MRRLVYIWLMIVLSSAAVNAAEVKVWEDEPEVTININTSSPSYISSGAADEAELDGWQIWVKRTTFQSISDEDIIRKDTDASGSASFDLQYGDYYVGAVYFDKSGDFYVPTYMGISSNAAGDGLNILNVPDNTTADINNFSQAGAVRGYVTDADGKGINGAKITVVSGPYTVPYPVTTRTFDGKDGYYSIFLSPGSYTLEVEKSGYATAGYDVAVTQGYGSTGSEFTNITLVSFTANESKKIDFEDELGIPLSITITTKSDLTAGIVPTVADDAEDLGAHAYSFGDDKVIGKYFEIDVSDNINSTSGNLTNVTLTMYYNEADLNGADEDTLKLYWYYPSGGEWKPLVKGKDYSPLGGPEVFDSGQDASANKIWATLDHFSIFVLVGTVIPTPEETGGGGGGGCDHELKIADIRQTGDAVPGAEVQFQVDIENTGTCAETGVKTAVTDLPAGWTSDDVTTDVGYGKTASVTIPVSIPEDAATGTVTLTFRVTPQDFISTLEKQVSFDVGEAQPEEEEVSPAPTEEEEGEGVETVAPPEIETPAPAPPVETQPPEEEPAKAPGEEKGGICGPTVVVLLAMAALVFARGRRAWK